ncbi:hypothetical protein MUK70_27675 [Dyadobacter chenwenxiniae]|uniref:Uncharacterized protein n=1 Tax=Dyadobacter chenwenxiniae TaxID=2906456 RepID=A0A9X1TF81_9BACT|nr:hypothetical protein [Dyadobacter chenwenxiniae]MCF0064061.1 hypothetical protein [Dyadobacter chenwenxiniae]UON82789.1 hypothetical protein MUK70_27675 [Dyadobacter chenwenxiniae]
MTTIKIEIEQENDVSLLKKVLTELGFKFILENEDLESSELSEREMIGINAGLQDVQEGRVFSHEYAKSRIEDKISQLRVKYGS